MILFNYIHLINLPHILFFSYNIDLLIKIY
nr:MAG TPA: hypothetical protein [Caudoviricetes sp.]